MDYSWYTSVKKGLNDLFPYNSGMAVLIYIYIDKYTSYIYASLKNSFK